MDVNNLLLEVKNVSMHYDGIVAFDNISFKLNSNAVLGIIGPNEAGKSTLVSLLSGSLKPNSGSIEFEGNVITDLPAYRRAKMGIVRTYQIPRPFLNMTVCENLLAARYSLNPYASSTDAISASNEIMDKTGLFDVSNLLCRELPLFRRKRLEIARALALKPKLIVLDEVGAGLVDSEISDLIQLINLVKNEVDGIIIFEHVMRVIRECCDNSFVIEFGRKIAESGTINVLNSSCATDVYLGAS